jgi:hypothetical protein
VRPGRSTVKKADAAGHPGVNGRVGLLGNGPPGTAGLPFVSSSNVSNNHCTIRGGESKWIDGLGLIS